MSEKNEQTAEANGLVVTTTEDGKPEGPARSQFGIQLQNELRSFAESVFGDVSEQIKGEIARATKRPSTERPPIGERSEGQGGGGYGLSRLDQTRIRDGRDSLYDALPEKQRKWRGVRSDELQAQWIRAMIHNDRHQMRMANLQLEELYGRADLAEGAVTAESGLSQGTGADLIPLPTASLIVLARNRMSKVRGFAQRFTSASRTLRVPVGSVATAGMVAEDSTASEGNPTFSTKLLTKHKAQAKFIMTDELVEDSAFNIVSILTERAGSALGALEDVQACTSDGNAPNTTESFESATLTEVSEAAAGSLGFADVVKLLYALPEQYRRDAWWFCNSFMLSLLTQMVDTNGRQQFVPGLAPATPISDSMPNAVGTLLGRPIMELPLTETACTSASALFIGLPTRVGFLDGGGLRVRASEHVQWANDVIEVKVTERFDTVILEEGAFRFIDAITALA